MKINLRFTLAVILLLSFTHVSATTYTWTDENGKKHFSDTLPDKYKDKSAVIEEKDINTMEIKSTNEATGKVLEKRSEEAKQVNSDWGSSYAPGNGGSCAQQQSAFAASERCYEECQIRTEGGGVNNASCSGCGNVKKPNC